MKKILLITAAILFAYVANAQIFSEDFESVTADEDVAVANWTNAAEVGSRVWLGKEYDGNKYAQASAYNSGEANTMWLITPAIDISGYTDETLAFDVNIGYWTHAALTVHISTDFAGDATTATWDDVTSSFTIPETPTDGYGSFASAGTMDISSYEGEIYIAFKYTGDDNNSETTTIQVDNVVVDGTVGIGQVATSELSIFPNPAGKVLNVEAGNNLTSVEILNVIGQTVMTVEPGTAATTINTESLNKGAYFVRTTDVNGNNGIAKFIKE